MNEWLTEPFAWDDSRQLDRGKVMTAEMLDAGADFGRYKDVDGDGIPFRTYPGTHPSKGAYFTRGTTKNAYATYSEQGADYVYNVQRLLRKFDSAKELVPQPVATRASQSTRFGVIYYGSTSPAMAEAHANLESRGTHVDLLRLRAFPFSDAVADFVLDHQHVFVVEQNRDGQLRTLLVNELGVDPARLVPVLHFDGTPITARFITREIEELTRALDAQDLRQDKVA
jgi:2-oxoglutarate ferredoxin oxidoreductase subunit alpha